MDQEFATTCDEPRQRLFQETLLRTIGHLARETHVPIHEPDHLHGLALEGLIHALLGTGSQRNAAVCAAFQAVEETNLGSFTPEQVGHLYEYARGFTLALAPPLVAKRSARAMNHTSARRKAGSRDRGDRDFLDVVGATFPSTARGTDSARVRFISSASGKRNQGLFYTPARIVEHMVRTALDALNLSDPADYLHLRILDPSVGTGTFLLAALEEMTVRVLKGSAIRNAGSAVMHNVRQRLEECARACGRACDPDEATAIRVHIMSTCLYGVDLDPLAVHIARVALKRRAFKEWIPIQGVEPKIRVGNALIGNAPEYDARSDTQDQDERHCRAYFRTTHSVPGRTRDWVERKKVFHWAQEFPDVFSSDRKGFDCVIGNPPYEILSVKESGVSDRRLEQHYFRAMYRTCQGKINTYRLMMERGLSVLRDEGVLVFIVPATLLADATAEKLRTMFLQESRIIETLIIPEKAQAFPGVTQAFVVLACSKGGCTLSLEPVVWDGQSPVRHEPHAAVDIDLIQRIGFRIPRLNAPREKPLLELLLQHPRLEGNAQVPPLGRVHQGEMNLTVTRAFITNSRTDYPLIRGEHVLPLRVRHPSLRDGRLDWVVPEFLVQADRNLGGDLNYRLNFGSHDSPSRPSRPWELDRIVLGRVVNMETKRRLKAAAVYPGQFLGDMTNFIAASSDLRSYLLGLLNSRLLNWRIKLTSTNNYLSAAEVASLPVPRPKYDGLPSDAMPAVRQNLIQLLSTVEGALPEWVEEMRRGTRLMSPSTAQAWAALMVMNIVQQIRESHDDASGDRDPSGALWDALDAAVLLLYGCESHVDVLL